MKEKNVTFVLEYWETINLETLHHHSQKWISEMSFWKNELHFMHNLLQKHFLFFFGKERIGSVKLLANRLSNKLTEELQQLEQEVRLHEDRLVELIKSSGKKRADAYRMEHSRLDDKFNQFGKDFKRVKQELFQMGEAVLKEEKMK